MRRINGALSARCRLGSLVEGLLSSNASGWSGSLTVTSGRRFRPGAVTRRRSEAPWGTIAIEINIRPAIACVLPRRSQPPDGNAGREIWPAIGRPISFSGVRNLPAMRHAIILSTTAFCTLLSACASDPLTFPAAAPSTGKRTPPVERDFRAADVAKADVDIVAEAHVRECLASARLSLQELYRRNLRGRRN